MEGYLQHQVTIAGDVLLMHNGQLADPLNRYTKALKAVTSKRKKTDEDHADIARAEYEGSLYLEDGKPVLDSRLLEACIAEGARVTKAGKVALAATFVDTNGALTYRGGPLTVAELLDSEEHRLTVGVRVNQARCMRTRPLFRDWAATFKVSLLASMADTATLRRWLEDAGMTKGIGDYRPRYGRFTVQAIDVL